LFVGWLLCFVQQDAKDCANGWGQEQREENRKGLLYEERNHTQYSEYKSKSVGEGQGPGGVHSF
jgi:hypothetical protein